MENSVALNEPLENLQKNLNAVLIQIGRTFRDADKNSPAARQSLVSKGQKTELIAKATHNFHDALDEFETELLQARAALERDLNALRSAREEKERAANASKITENAKDAGDTATNGTNGIDGTVNANGVNQDFSTDDFDSLFNDPNSTDLGFDIDFGGGDNSADLFGGEDFTKIELPNNPDGTKPDADANANTNGAGADDIASLLPGDGFVSVEGAGTGDDFAMIDLSNIEGAFGQTDGTTDNKDASQSKDDAAGQNTEKEEEKKEEDKEAKKDEASENKDGNDNKEGADNGGGGGQDEDLFANMDFTDFGGGGDMDDLNFDWLQ